MKWWEKCPVCQKFLINVSCSEYYYYHQGWNLDHKCYVPAQGEVWGLSLWPLGFGFNSKTLRNYRTFRARWLTWQHWCFRKFPVVKAWVGDWKGSYLQVEGQWEVGPHQACDRQMRSRTILGSECSRYSAYGLDCWLNVGCEQRWKGTISFVLEQQWLRLRCHPLREELGLRFGGQVGSGQVRGWWGGPGKDCVTSYSFEQLSREQYMAGRCPYGMRMELREAWSWRGRWAIFSYFRPQENTCTVSTENNFAPQGTLDNVRPEKHSHLRGTGNLNIFSSLWHPGEVNWPPGCDNYNPIGWYYSSYCLHLTRQLQILSL